MDLNRFIEQGIGSIATALSNFYISECESTDFLMSLVPSLALSTEIRQKHEERGHHIPPFLIASIASKCNLHCAGCYARAGGICAENQGEKEMSVDDWKKVLAEASELGISFVLLAGGEPLLRRDIISMAADFPNMIFPIFTNGTLMDEAYIELFNKRRNLIPFFSIEGDAKETDLRRGEGVSKNVGNAMEKLHTQRVLFAASVTVTNRNLKAVVSEGFLKDLRSKGCGAVFFVEYVPAEKGTEGLVLSEDEAGRLNTAVRFLKAQFT
ncbi:MAG: radical SAM protein, partial [Oscillospiraceae bacterium]